MAILPIESIFLPRPGQPRVFSSSDQALGEGPPHRQRHGSRGAVEAAEEGEEHRGPGATAMTLPARPLAGTSRRWRVPRYSRTVDVMLAPGGTGTGLSRIAGSPR